MCQKKTSPDKKIVDKKQKPRFRTRCDNSLHNAKWENTEQNEEGKKTYYDGDETRKKILLDEKIVAKRCDLMSKDDQYPNEWRVAIGFE